MYKKRFAKWGFHKNSRRSTTSTPSSTTTISHVSEPPTPVLISPELCSEDSRILNLLSSVRTWNLSFYESVQLKGGASVPILSSWPEHGNDTNSTFKLVIDMLNRGHGNLAGRLARKAFLLVEEMLMLEGPALVWNVLEILHYMASQGHPQLLQLLLDHMLALVSGRMCANHPIHAILQALRGLITSSQNSTSLASTNSTSVSSSWPLLPRDKKATAASTCQSTSESLLLKIEKAWTLNAEILFDHFDTRLFQLYVRVHWDSCSIRPPAAIIRATKRWLANTKSHQTSGIAVETNNNEKLIQIAPFEQDSILQRMFTTSSNASPPQNYELLLVSSIAALQHHASFVCDMETNLAADTTLLLRMLAALVSAKILEQWPTTTGSSNAGAEVMKNISQGQASNIACALRTSMSFDTEHDGPEIPLDIVERVRSIMAFQEHANAETEPQVIREMWLLEDVLIAAGEYQEAFDIEQKAYRRLEKYIQDVPVDFV